MDEIYIKADDLNDWIKKYLPKNQDLYSIDDLIGAIEDMDGEIERLRNVIDDLEEDIRENYRPIPVSEQYDVNECDFI